MLRDLYEARRRRRIREEVGGLVISAAFAALAGAAAGVLLAPKSGEETRRELIEGSKEVAEKAKLGARDLADEVYIRSLEARQTAKETVNKLASKTDRFIDDASEKGEEILDEAGNKVSSLKSDAKGKVEEVKDATGQLAEDLKNKTEEIEGDAKKFGRDINEEVENTPAMSPKDLEYNVCYPLDPSCKDPERDNENNR